MSNLTTQVYVLSRDRPEYLRETIRSFLSQSAVDYHLIVSDNSESVMVENMMRDEFPNVTYVRRNPTLSAQEHFSTIFKESSSNYLVLFHDDDYADFNYIKKLTTYLDNNLDIAAVGCNAWIVKGSTRTSNLFMTYFKSPLIFKTPNCLIPRYLRFISEGVAPFPSYIYRRKFLVGSLLDYSVAGKYSDVTFLANLIKIAPIAWLSEPLISYRFHDSNDSAIDDIGHRLKLLRALHAEYGFKKDSSHIADYRYKFWSRYISSSANNNLLDHRYSQRLSIVRRFVFMRRISYFFSPSVWMRVLRRLLTNNLSFYVKN